MPRGSKPGERRGGRQRGTPNKKTLLKNAVFLAAAADPNRSPLDFMLALMRDSQVPLDLRIDMAAAAAPLVHARPKASGRSRPHPMEIRARRAKAAALSRPEEPTLAGGAEKPEVPRSQESEIPTTPENATVPNVAETEATLTTGAPEASGRGGLKLSELPLDFLLGVMHDPEVIPKQRVRAARIAARYKHQPPERVVHVVEDEFGFKIDPMVARAVREIKRQYNSLPPTPAASPPPADFNKTEDVFARLALLRAMIFSLPLAETSQKKKRLLARLSDRLESIECPDGYGWPDLEKDEERLREFNEWRGSKTRHGTKAKLTPEEDAEEAYLITRTEVYRRTPKHEAWCRITKLEQARANGKEPTAAELSELDDLRARFPTATRGWEPVIRPKVPSIKTIERISELEERRFDQTLTPAEAEELEELRRQYPDSAKRTRELMTRRLEQGWTARGPY